MADEKLTQLTAATTVAAGDILYVVRDPLTVPISRKITVDNFMIATSTKTKTVCHIISNPQAYYAQRPEITLLRADYNLTITQILILGSDWTPTAELAGDLMFADDNNTGGFAGATIIDVCDTSGGIRLITSGFDDPTVPSGKIIYFKMDSSPHADWKDFYIQVNYTAD